MMILYVCFVDGKPKGLLTEKDISEVASPWWTEAKKITVSKADWEAEKIRIDNIHNYL